MSVCVSALPIKIYMMALVVKNPPANAGDLRETQLRSLGQEDALEEGGGSHSRTLARRIPRGRGAWGAAVHGSQRVGHG